MSERITLRDGPTVDAESIRLAIDLERRQFVLHRRGDQIVVVMGAVAKGDYLTMRDRDAITTWKPDLLALLAYRAPEPTP